MKNFTKLACAAFVLMFTLFARPVQASHLKGGDTYFICLGNGQYELVFSCYYACEPTSIAPDPAAADFSWTVTSSCGTVPTTITAATATTAVDVPFYCPGVLTQCDYGYPYSNAPANAPVGTLVITYTSAPFTIPAGCTVTADMYFSARNAAISNLVNPANYGINIQTSITTPATGNTCQNNPLFAAYPVNVFCNGLNANFSQGAIDLGGDSLTYTLVNPQDFGNVPIPFVTGCTPGNPLGVGSAAGFASYFHFDSTTGNINFTPTATGDYVLAVQVNAYQNGVLVGTTMRDIQFTVVNCTDNNHPPVLPVAFTTSDVIGATVIDSNHIGVCPGEQVTINLISVDQDSFNYIIDSTNVLAALPGSTVTETHYGNGIHDTTDLRIMWTPTCADSGFHYFIVTVRDTVCPTPGRNTYAFIVSVLQGVYAGPNKVYCDGGVPDTLFATGANHYIWTDSATGGTPVGVIGYGPDSSYIIVSPSSIPLYSSVGYVVTGDLLGACKNKDTVSVRNAPLFALSAFALDTSICKYTHTQLTVTPNPLSVGPFTYSWSPPGSVVSPTLGSTATTSLTSSTEFYVTVTAAGGCAIVDSAHVAINGSAPRIYITPSNNNVCPGDTVQLTTKVFAENLVACGTVDTCPANNILSSVAVNNDTSSSTGGAFGTQYYGSPFMGSFDSYKAQYIFTKAELNAAGMSSGSITDISFFVKQINSTAPYDTFSISMGCTNLDSLTTFVNNLVEVVPPQYGPNAVYPNQGWTPFPFTHFYNWDGSSNLVIQVCYTIDPSINSADDYVSFTTTPYNGSSITAADYTFFGNFANGCSLDNTADFYQINNTRPNIKFGECSPNVLTYHWAPATLLCDTCANTAVIVNSSQTYTLTVSAGQCTNDTTVTVNINPYLATVALPDTFVCYGDTLQLSVSLTHPAPSQCVQTYSVSAIPYAPISSATATQIQPYEYISSQGYNYSTDDGTAGPYAVGFNFPFYCQSYSQFYVNSNGWITFEYPYPATSNTQEYTAQAFPPAAGDLNPQKVIELMMGNYYLSDGFGDGGGTIDYFMTGTAPNRIMVVQFVQMSDETLAFTTSGEIHMHESTGVIDILLGSSNYGGTQHTTGVKDSTGLGTAAPGENNQVYTISTPKAWSFTPVYGPSVAVQTSIWSPNSFLSNDSSLTPLAYPPSSQTYTVNSNVIINQYSNPELCAVRDTLTVNVDHFTHTLTVAPQTICPGDTAQITFNPQGTTVSSYVWTPAFGLSSTTIADPFASILDSTTYHVTAIDNHGCKANDSVSIAVIPTPRPLLSPDSLVCYSDSVLLSLSGPYNYYQWYTIDTTTGARVLVSSGANDVNFYGHPNQNYILAVTPTAGGCRNFTNVVFIDSFLRPAIHVDTFGPTRFCIGDHVVLETDQGLTNVQWTPASYGSQTSFAITTPGSFSYTARDANGCLEYSNTVVVSVSQLPVFTVSSTKDPICTGETDTLVASTTPAANITWVGEPAGNTLISSTPGTYEVTADLNGCINDSTIALLGAASPIVALPASITECSCNPDTIVITPVLTPNNPGNTFVWSNGGTGYTTLDSILGSQTLSVTVTDANGCTATSNVLASMISCPGATISVLPVSDSIFLNDTATLTATPNNGGAAYVYSWTNSITTHVITPNAAITGVIGDSLGIDTVYLTVNDNGCTYNTFTIIHVVEFGAFQMATAFTPNGDGMNDYFYPVLNGPNSPAKITAFRIYDRWGQLVYDNPNAPGWNGQYGGQPQVVGTYLYFVTIEIPDPNNAAKTVTKSVEGSFNLFR
jgi:gliding motility-associated-like protein